MSNVTTHFVSLSKDAQRQLQEKVIRSNLTTLLASVNTKSLKVKGWEVDVVLNPSTAQEWTQATDIASGVHTYTMLLQVTNTKDAPSTSEFFAIVNTLHQRSGQPVFGRWSVTLVDGKEWIPPLEGEIATSSDMLGYVDVEVPEDWDENFNHLFGLQPHVDRVKSALDAAISSDWANRFHVALIGPPGCGKSDICRSIKKALGEDAVLEFDATATTAAGAIKELTEREILPRVLLVEEIEKADEKALSFLMALCDLRGEIRKTTARNTIQRDTKMLVICTLNDEPLFDKLQANALSSRFSANKVYFRRPDRAMIAMILAREVDKVNGDHRWIEPTIEYAESHGISDPRQLIGLCLCGRDMWLTGEYRRMLDATSPIETETLRSPL